MPPNNTQRLLEKSRAMMAQYAAEGTKPFTGSRFDTFSTPPPQQPPTPQIGTPSSGNQSQQFGLALMDMLNKAKGMGTAGFAQQGFNAQQDQVQRQAYTAPGLIGAAPGVQAGARNAEASALNPTIRGAQQGAQTFSEQLGSFKEGVRDYQQILRDEETRQDREKQEARDVINDAFDRLGSSAFDYLDPKYFKLAGYTTETLNQAKQAAKTREAEEKALKKQVQTVDLGDKVGFFDMQGNLIRYEAKGAKPGEGTPTVPTGADGEVQLSANAQNWVSLIDNGGISLEDALTKIGTSKSGSALKNEVIAGLNQTGGRTKQKIQQLQDSVALIDKLIPDADYFGYSTGKVFGLGPLKANPYFNTFESRLKTLTDSLSAENLPLLKGPLSDRDIEFVRSMSSGLSTSIDQASAVDRLDKIKARLNQKITDSGVSAENGGGVLRSPDGQQEVNLSELTPAEIQEAKNAGWK